MSRSPAASRWTRVPGLAGAVLLQGLLASGVEAQERRTPWPGVLLGASVTHVVFSEAIDLHGFRDITGIGLGLQWLGRRGVGLDAALIYLPPRGFYDLTGGAAELGAGLGLPLPFGGIVLRGGAGGMIAGNSDGGYLAGAGPYVGAGLLVSVSPRVALRADLAGRLLWGHVPSGAWSLGAGAVLRPGGS
jgi:hypothetical protein